MMAQSDVPLFVVMARVVEQRAGTFTSQNLANTLWAFATVAQSYVSLFAALAIVMQLHVGEFNA